MTQIPTRDADFYLNRFKEAVKTYTSYESDRVSHEFHVEIHEQVAIVVWDKLTKSPDPNAEERHTYQAFLWQVGGAYDSLPYLGWHYQGCITTLYSRAFKNLDSVLKKARKKADFFNHLYSHRAELIQLSRQETPFIHNNSKPVFNALVGDVVRIRAFGRGRLGKVVGTSGRSFIVAYMTPTNPNDVHYKTLPLAFMYERTETP